MKRSTETARVLPALVALTLASACKNESSNTDATAASSAPSVAASASAAAKADAPLANTSINTFLGRGPPTFIVGTAGNDEIDAAVQAQVHIVRPLFARSTVVSDESVAVEKGPEAWPRNPVVYGGPHVNSVVRRLGQTLPFSLHEAELAIGGETFDGRGYQLIAVVPERPASDDGPGHPEFLLYAGTGTPGIGEINAVKHGPQSFLLIDRFGPLRSGQWTRVEGAVIGELIGAPARRIDWRTVELPESGDEAETLDDLAEEDGKAAPTVSIHVHFPVIVKEKPSRKATLSAIEKGVQKAVARMLLTQPVELDVYVHPDRKSKESLTGYGGDGHAVVASSTVHVLDADTVTEDGLMKLVAHEATHVLSYDQWGATASPLIGEGLAVMVADAYGGQPLMSYKGKISDSPQLDALWNNFRAMDEEKTYPLAGMFVRALIDSIGLEKFREHMLLATGETWKKKLEEAGGSPDTVTAAYEKLR